MTAFAPGCTLNRNGWGELRLLVFGCSLVICHKDVYRLVLSFLESKVNVEEYDCGLGIKSERNKMVLSVLVGTFFHPIVVRSTLLTLQNGCI